MVSSANWRPAFALAAFLAGGPSARAELRTWSDSSGKFSVEAEFVESTPEGVVLKHASGRTTTIPLARLSAADQAYVEAQTAPAAAPPAEPSRGAELQFTDPLTEPPAWADAGAPFDLAAFLAAPPPQDNAAPLYLEAFLEFSWGDLGFTIANPPADEGRVRHQRGRELSKTYEKFQQAWEQDPTTVDVAVVDEWLANHETGFAKLAAAQQRPACMFQSGLSIHSMMGHIQGARAVARAVVWRTRRNLARGDVQAALDDLRMLLRLNRDLRVRGSLIVQLVADAMDRITCGMVQEILAAPQLDARQCDALLAILAEHQAKTVDPLITANRAEYVLTRQALHDLQHRTGTFAPQTMKDDMGIDGDLTSPLTCFKFVASLGGLENEVMAKLATRLQSVLLPGAWQGGPMLSDADYAQEVAAVDRFYATVLALAERANDRRQIADELKAAEGSMQDTLFSWLLTPSEVALLNSFRRRDAALAGMQCLAALRRWQFDHADPPTDLATVVQAAGMPDVPPDPYSDGPLRLTTIADQPVVYSVGPDGRDDQAAVEWNEYPDTPGDLVFRLEK